MRRFRQIRNRRKHDDVLEAKVVSETKKAAKRAGFEHRKVSYVNRNGAPDDWFFGFGGRLIIVEFKAPGEAPRDNQASEIKRLRLRGFEVYVIDTVEAGVKLFEGNAQW